MRDARGLPSIRIKLWHDYQVFVCFDIGKWNIEHQTSTTSIVQNPFHVFFFKKNVSNACLHVLKKNFFVYVRVCRVYVYSVFSYMWWRVRVRYFVTEIILGEWKGTGKYSTMRKCILYPHKHISTISRDEKSINTLSCQRICTNFHSTNNLNSLSFSIYTVYYINTIDLPFYF